MTANGRSRLSGLRARLASHKLDIALVAGLWLVGALGFRLLAELHVGPLRAQDEFLFWHAAKNFAAGDGMSWRGADLNLTAPLYVWLISLSFGGGAGAATAYDRLHWINAVAMTGVVVPTFVLARHYVSHWWAFAAAALAIAVPSMSYVGLVTTEPLAYPIFVAVAAAGVVALHTPTRCRWLTVLALAVLAVLTRSQFVVLFAIFPLAIVLHAWMRQPGERADCLRAHREAMVMFTILLLAGLLVFAANPRGVLGVYQGLLDHDTVPSASNLWFWLRGFIADSFLVSGIAPSIALIVLVLGGVNRRDRRMSALIAITVVTTALLVAQAVWFSSSMPFDIRKFHWLYERYIFYIAPLFFVALVASVGRTGVKDLSIATCLVAAGLVLFSSDHAIPFSYDAWGLMIIGGALENLPAAKPFVGLLLAGLAGLLGGVMLMATRGRTLRLLELARYAPLIGSVAVLLLLAQAYAWNQVRSVSRVAYGRQVKPLDFIDRSFKEPVGLFAFSEDYVMVELWNERVNRVFTVRDGPSLLSPHCEFSLDRRGFMKGCDGMPRAFFLDTNFLTIDFYNARRRLRPRATAQLVSVSSPARVRSAVGGRDAYSGTVPEALDIVTYLDHDAEAIFKLAPSDVEFVAVDGDGRTRQIAAGRRTSVVIPMKRGKDKATLSLLLTNGSANRQVVVEDVLLRVGGNRLHSIL